MATNITSLPQTANANTTVARITKMALQRASTDPILNRFLKNDGSFNQDLDKSFDRGDVANIMVAPKLSAVTSANVGDTVTYSAGTFDKVSLTLDKITYTAFTHRNIDQAIADINIRENLAEEAGTALIEGMYQEVIRLLANNAYIAADQELGSAGTDMNYNLLRRLRTTAEIQFNIKRSDRIVVVLNPYAYEALTKDSAFQYQISGDSNSIRTGIISTVLNMEIYSDTTLSNTVANGSMTISGTNGAVGIAMLPEAGVLATRQIDVVDPSRQFIANVQGVSALYTSTYDSQYVGGMKVDDKLEVMYGFQTLPVKRHDQTSQNNAKVWLLNGGLA